METCANVDSLLVSVGEFGLYQKLMFALLCVPACISGGWTAFSHVFIAATPRHACRAWFPSSAEGKDPWSVSDDATFPKVTPFGKLVANLSEAMVACYQRSGGDNSRSWNNTEGTTPCQVGWAYERTSYQNTVVTKFDLVCDKSEWPATVAMAYYAGSFFGNLLFGLIADRYGRKTCLLVILLNHVIFSVASVFAPNVYAYVVLRFFTGAGLNAFYTIPFILSLEIVGPNKRTTVNAIMCIAYGVSLSIFGFVASLLRNGDNITLICTASSFLTLLYYRVLPESPRWLITRGRNVEATNLLMKMAKTNGQRCDVAVLQSQCETLVADNSKKGKTVRWQLANLFKLFQRRNMLVKTLLITCIWFINDLLYSGMMYNIPNLQLDDYLSFSLNGLAEIPAYTISWIVINRYGRRNPLSVSMMLTAVTCFTAICLPAGDAWIVGGLAVGARFFISISFATISVYFNELYPTTLRGIGMGMTTMVSSIGMIFTPYMAYTVNYSRILPLLLMGVLAASASVLVPILPETAHRELPQSLDDAEKLPVKCYSCSRAVRKRPAAISTIY